MSKLSESKHMDELNKAILNNLNPDTVKEVLDNLRLIKKEKISIQSDNHSNNNEMMLLIMSKVIVNTKTKEITIVSPKNVINTFKEFKNHPYETLMNTLNNFLTIEGIATLSADFVSGSLGGLTLLSATAKSFKRQIIDIDTATILQSLVDTTSNSGLTIDDIFKNVNELLKNEMNYEITIEKVRYILNQLQNDLGLVKNINNERWFLVETIEIN